jgi:iron(III) transport system substrate-binding protein
MSDRVSSRNHIIFLVWALFLFSSVSAFCADSAKIDAARKEGKVVFYTVMNAANDSVMVREFKKKYPGIAVEGWRGGSEAMLSRILAEARAGAFKADLIFSGGAEMQVFKKKRLLQTYVSPEAKVTPDNFKDRDGYWINVHPLLQVVGYNTEQVKPKDVPRTYEDLLKPQWKSQMSMDRVEYAWFATLQKAWGREKAIAYCKKLATQDIRFDSGHTKIATLVAAGDIPVGINLFAYRVAEFKGKGAPINWVGLDPVVAILEVAAVTRTAQHPNAAKLLMDFMLSVDGQNLIRSFGRVPGRPGVEPLDKDLGKIKAYPMDVEAIYTHGLEPFGKEYREIFGIK